MYYDLAGQVVRQQQIYAKLVEYSLAYFDAEGKWVGEAEQPRLRERLWYAISYISSGDAGAIKIANKIMRTTSFSECHFTLMAAAQLLLKYKDKLDMGNIEVLEKYLLGALDFLKDPDLDFRGANDNYPTMGCYTSLACGIYFHLQDLYELGAQRILSLKELLTRRGFVTEFNSPTYTAIQVYCMAEIAELVEEAEMKQIVLQIEERLWVDVWSHYHPTTYQSAGPYSRAYAVDSTAHTHQARYIMYAILGDQLVINPWNTLFSTQHGKQGELIHYNLPFMQVGVGWLLNTVFHCPEYLVKEALNRTYPYRVQGTYENASSTHHPQPGNPNESDDIIEAPAGSGSNSTYMTADYALGVITREFRTGVFTDSFHLLYRLNKVVLKQEDIATVYTNYIVNDKRPSEMNEYDGLNWRNWVDSVLDEGRKIGLQHDRTAMLLYKPKLCLNQQVTSLKLSLLFSARYGFVEEVWLGQHNLAGLEGSSADPCPVFIKDGPVYMAFFPLIFVNHGREAAVKVEKINEYLMISFYNYEGEVQDFAKRAFLLTGNGFVAEIRSEAEVGSFQNFRELFNDVKILDEWAYGNKITSMRRTVYERDDLKMECIWSPISEGIKQATINGKIPQEPLLAITGLDASKLPFLEGESTASLSQGSSSIAPR
jgi:hypothetical protein